ncbi:hypothetical protein ACFYUV_50025 [Nonomuraea sp. NPDC003560]|uniref:hypothetical protein n=1 Tax=Nonomuraea sp. NPDC003560 TaxID=3364341 RepID=UPI0036A5222E
MRPVPVISAATAAVALALTCAPASAAWAAWAAPGTVRLFSPNGQTRTITNPQPGQCHPGLGPNSALLNQTEGTILVFPDSNCRLRVYDPVQPAGLKNGNIGSFYAQD